VITTAAIDHTPRGQSNEDYDGRQQRARSTPRDWRSRCYSFKSCPLFSILLISPPLPRQRSTKRSRLFPSRQFDDFISMPLSTYFFFPVHTGIQGWSPIPHTLFPNLSVSRKMTWMKLSVEYKRRNERKLLCFLPLRVGAWPLRRHCTSSSFGWHARRIALCGSINKKERES
jgi:hypothetical protein